MATTDWRNPIAPWLAGVIGGVLVGVTMALSVRSVWLGIAVGVPFGVVVWAVWRFGVHALRLRARFIERVAGDGRRRGTGPRHR